MTVNHEHPELVGLLRGELTNAEVTAVAAHLDTCDACRRELSELTVGHAFLAGASRTLGDRAPLALPDPPELPDLSELQEPAAAQARDRAVVHWLRPVGLVAAAAALIVGSVGVTRLVDRPSEPAPVAAPDRAAPLEPVEGAGGGRVEMASDHDEVLMTVETHDLPKIGDGEFYYVWLFNPATGKMLPLGVVGPRGVASFELPDSLVGRYQAVDVSLERDDGDPGHSVTSVLRATYA
jgi:hypothetical protein